MEIIAILKTIDMLLTVSAKFGVNLHKFNEMRAQAQAEGRDLTDEELGRLSGQAHKAVSEL